MYCIHCGSQNRDGAKFCIECGQPLSQAQQPTYAVEQAPQPVIAPGSSPTTRSGVTARSRIAAIAALIAVIGFFLPWVTVSCGGEPVMTVSGFQVAKGGVIQTVLGPSDPMPSSPKLFITLGAAVLVCLSFYLVYASRRMGFPVALLQMAVAAIGLWQMFAELSRLRAENTSPDQWVPVTFSTQFGLWATAAGLVGVLIGGFLSLPELLRRRAP